MPEGDISQLILSVVERGRALGANTEPGEIRRRFSATRRPGEHRFPATSVVRRRVGALLVAAVIVAVFFAPLPHVSLFGHLVAPAGKTPASSTVASTRPQSAPASGQSIAEAWTVGPGTVWAWTESFANGDAQGVELSTDAGKLWSDVTPPGLSKAVGDHFITDLFALDSERAWISYGGAGSQSRQTIAATTDGGQQWTPLGPAPSSVGANPSGCALQFVNASDGWCTLIGPAAGSETVAIYRTADGGRHWRLITETTPEQGSPGALPFGCDKNVQFVSATQGWAVFSCNGGVPPIYRTTDGGTTWQRSDIPAPPDFSRTNGSGFAGLPVMAGAEAAVGFTSQPGGGSQSVVYVSTDGAKSWHVVVPPGQPEGWLVDTLTPMRWRLVNGNHILSTDDGGRSWKTITSNVRFRLNYSYGSPTAPAVDFVTDQVGWISAFSGENGYSLWRTTDGGSTWHRVVVPGT